MKNSSKLGSVHWDLLESMQTEADWITSRTLHDRLRPKYGYSAAVAKTIQRALRRLLDAGLIEGRGKGSARSWRNLPERTPNKIEVKSVDLAIALLQLESFAANQLPAEPLKILRDYCDRSRELLHSHPTYPRYLQGRAWLGKAAIIDSGYPLIAPPQDEKVIQALMDALYRSVKLHLYYKNAAMSTDTPASYHVSPLALIERGSVLYLVSCRRSRRNGNIARYLHRIDRIVKALVTQDPADADKNFDLERFLRHEHSLLFFPESPQRITLKVRERGYRSRLRQYRLSEDQVIIERPGGFELVATVRPSLTFKQFLLGLAPDAILTEPVSLRKELSEILASAAASYCHGEFNEDDS